MSDHEVDLQIDTDDGLTVVTITNVLGDAGDVDRALKVLIDEFGDDIIRKDGFL